MKDIEIAQSFKRIQQSDNVPDHLAKIVKGLRSWYKKTGGLSQKQIELLKNIENQLHN